MSYIAVQQKHFAQLMHDAEAKNEMSALFATSDLEVETGLAVYRNNLKVAWRNALIATFPVLSQLLSNEGMGVLAHDYLKVHPSQSGDLNDLGVHLSDFLKDYPPLADYPYLPEVAALEWRVNCAHGAADHVPLQIADLMVHGTEDWLAARVEFASSASLMMTQAAAGSIWLAHQADGDLSVLQRDSVIAQSERILISRPLWRVEVRVLDEAIYQLLIQLRDGASFEQAFTFVEQQGVELDLIHTLPMLLESGVWANIIF